MTHEPETIRRLEARISQLLAERDAARAEGVRAGLEKAAQDCRMYPRPHGHRIAEILDEDAADPQAVAQIVAGMKGQTDDG